MSKRRPKKVNPTKVLHKCNNVVYTRQVRKIIIKKRLILSKKIIYGVK